MRETTILRAAVSGILCGTLFFLGILTTASTSLKEWRAADLLPVAVALFGPLVLVAWSVFALRRWRAQTLLWVRRAVLSHAVAAFLFALPSCWALLAGLPDQNFLVSDRIFNPFFGVFSALIGVIDLALLGLLPKSSSDREMLGRYRKLTLAVGGGALLAVAIWPFAIAALAATEAEIMAGGRPYCIQVSADHHGGYRGVTSISDMNGLKMQAPAGFIMVDQDNFHAMLIIEMPDARLAWRNWSYSWDWFVLLPEETVKAMYLRRPDCEPKAHFARQLPMLPPS